MRHATTLAVVVMLVASAGLAGVAAGASTGTAQTTNDAAATAGSIQFSGQTSGGTTVVVDSVTLPEGGFVTIHDGSLGDGAVLGSVAGTSAYLEPGTHENVVVTLDEPLSSDASLTAMAHRDTNDDRIYGFVASNGDVDGPYTNGGSAVVSTADVTVSATVTMDDQPTDGTTVVVDRVELSQPGFVTIHDERLADGEALASVVGTSEYLEAGVHENVRVQLDTELTGESSLTAMPHMDTDDDQTYDFVTSEGSDDGPFTNADNAIVVDGAAATVSSTANVSFDAQATGGTTVVVERAFLPEGGFVTVHDGTLAEGDTFESVRGTSAYLSPGLHEDVRITLDDPVTESTALVPMAHRDTDGDQTYDFLTSDGGDDGPYTADGGAVIAQANVTVSASVSMSDQSSNGHSVTIDSVDLSEGGFVTVHGASLLGGEVFGSVVGTSEYLKAGHHENVTVKFDEPIQSTQTLIPMAHRDTNGNQAYDFVTSEGGADGPFVADGGAVIDTARTTVLASVTFDDQVESDDGTVTVDSVTLRDGGFVTIHDGTLLEGEVFGSVAGTSTYLSPGTHENVTIELTKEVAGNATLIAMPHRDTNGNEMYDFVEDEGAADGPYLADGGANVEPATVTAALDATVSLADQETDGTTIVVEEVTLSRGGFVTIHGPSLQDGEAIGSVLGTSQYLEAGTHENVEITLETELSEDTTVIAMPHRETDGDETYDFVTSEGATDGPYTNAEGAVVASASASVTGTDETMATTAMDEETTTMDEMESTEGEGGSPGFGVGLALVALVAAALLAVRRQH